MQRTMRPRYAITFDIDWAPDWAIAICADLSRRRGIPATFFATHASEALNEVREDRLFEVGIHPNFLNGSSHGTTFEDVMESCLAMVPEAHAMRSHDLFCCSGLLALIAERYGQIATDCSIFLPGYEDCRPVVAYHGNPVRRLVRIPFCFADNVAARTPGWNWANEPPFGSGLKVFNFHPALIALNLGTPAAYARLKVSLGSRRLDQATPDDFSPFANAGPGARIFLERLLESLSPDDCARVSDVAAAHAGAVR
jgi:hypothetical protein